MVLSGDISSRAGDGSVRVSAKVFDLSSLFEDWLLYGSLLFFQRPETESLSWLLPYLISSFRGSPTLKA